MISSSIMNYGKISDIQFEDIPTLDEYVANQIGISCPIILSEAESKGFKAVMSDWSADDPTMFTVFNDWPECDLAAQVFTDTKLKELAKDSTWNAILWERGFDLVTNGFFDSEVEGGNHLISMLSGGDTAPLDSIHAMNFAISGHDESNAYVLNHLTAGNLSQQGIDVLNQRGGILPWLSLAGRR